MLDGRTDGQKVERERWASERGALAAGSKASDYQDDEKEALPPAALATCCSRAKLLRLRNVAQLGAQEAGGTHRGSGVFKHRHLQKLTFICCTKVF